MRHIVVLVWCSLFSYMVVGQPIWQEFPVENTRFYGIEAGYGLVSSSLNNQLVKSYYLGEFLPNELKDKNQKEQSATNTLGFDYQSKLTYGKYKAKKRAGYWGSVGYQHLVQVNYADDFYDLYFYGNTPYKGNIMDLSHQFYRQMGYYYVQGGYYTIRRKPNTDLVIGTGISLYGGKNTTLINIDKAHFFTSMASDSIHFDMAGDMWIPDTTSKRFSPFEGIGAGISLVGLYRWGLNTVSWDIQDIGFIRWGQQQGFSSGNPSIEFQGIEVDYGASSIQGVGISEIKDSLLRAYLPSTKQVVSTRTPMKAAFTYKRKVVDELDVYTDLSCLYAGSFMAEAGVGVRYSLGNKWVLMPSYRWNTFRRSMPAIAFQWKPYKMMAVNVKFHNLAALLYPASSYGQAVSFSLLVKK